MIESDKLAYENGAYEYISRFLSEDEDTGAVDENFSSKSTVLYDELVALIAPAANALKRQFINIIVRYIDRNSESLIISGPYKHLIFIDASDGDILFQLFKIDKKSIQAIIKKSPLIKSTFRTLNNPFFFLLTTLAVIYDEENDPLTRDAKYFAMLYMAIRLYSSRQGHMWKFEANKDIMEYTINNLNNRFIFKTEGSVLNVLKHIVLTNDFHVGTNLRKTHKDSYFKYYITNISTRINNTLTNIFIIYDKNSKDKNYLGTSEDRYNDEHNSIKEMTNISASIINIATSTYMRIKNNPIDIVLLDDASTATKLKKSSVLHTMEHIIEHETQKLQDIILYIIQVFITTDSKNKISHIKSRYFALYCMKLYKFSNSKNEYIITIKNILNTWVEEYGTVYIRLNRMSTRINFRKVIYMYLVSCIIKYA